MNSDIEKIEDRDLISKELIQITQKIDQIEKENERKLEEAVSHKDVKQNLENIESIEQEHD